MPAFDVTSLECDRVLRIEGREGLNHLFARSSIPESKKRSTCGGDKVREGQWDQGA